MRLEEGQAWVDSKGFGPWSPQPGRQASLFHGDARAAVAELGWRGLGVLWTWCSCWGVRDGAGPQPAHPLPTFCSQLGTCYGQGQLLGGAQHVPGQAVDPGQLASGRRGAVPWGRGGSFQGLGSPHTPYRGLCLGVRRLWPSHCSQLCPLLAPALDFQVHQEAGS